MTLKEAILTLENVSKTYQGVGYEVHALRDVSFQVEQGEFLAVMGTSGSGKSTLLNILGALDEPTNGNITLQNENMKRYFSEPMASQFRRNYIGFIFQAYHLLKDLTVEENIALPLILQGADKHKIQNQVTELMELVGLNEWRKHRPIHLSGGQKQRVAIARALITHPPIVLADEPTGNLDYNMSKEVLNILLDVRKRFDTSIILVTHDPMVASYADRILFFHDGAIMDEYRCNRRENHLNVILKKMETMLVIDK